jgi:hypothetical protein
MSAKNVQIAQFRPRATESASDGTVGGVTMHLGHVVAILNAEELGVTVSGMPGTLTARLAVPLTHARLQEIIASRRDAVILIDTHAPASAIVLGFLEPVPCEASPEAPDIGNDQKAAAEHTEVQVVEADVDGKRVRIVGSDEIVLECGAASITLRRNGRVIIRGAYVETDSAGTNRIKGAAVRIN